MYIRFYLYGYNLKEQLYEGVVDPLIKLEAILLHGTDNSKSKLLGQAEAALVSSTDASNDGVKVACLSFGQKIPEQDAAQSSFTVLMVDVKGILSREAESVLCPEDAKRGISGNDLLTIDCSCGNKDGVSSSNGRPEPGETVLQ